jgi:hypothetical protein
MPNPGKLRVTLADVRGQKIKESVDVTLRSQGLGGVMKAILRPSVSSTITNLRGRPEGVYQIYMDPPSYQPVNQFIEVMSDGVTPLNVTCAVDPMKVKDVVFSPFEQLSSDSRRTLEASSTVLGFEGKSGAVLLGALDVIRRAGFMNIMAKSTATVFENGRSVASYFQELRELRGDRFFAKVPQELREETKNSVSSGLFHSVSGALHHLPNGFAPAGSFKTDDHYGNLQLTFSVKGDDWRADVDIDDAGGVEHIFQVLGNALSGEPTHPYNIHELLIQYQKLEPGYDLLV